MTRTALFSLLLLAACGVDGEPVAPQVDVVPGITLSGSAEAGVVVGGDPADYDD